jgi:hypothetical protein
MVIVVTHFWVPTQNIKKKSKTIIKNNSSEKRMSGRPENGQKLVEEVQNTRIEI